MITKYIKAPKSAEEFMWLVESLHNYYGYSTAGAYQIVTDICAGYGVDPWYPPLIKRDELKEEQKDAEEVEEVNKTWTYWNLWNSPSSEKTCDHKWKSTWGLYREYKDCELCGIKFEDSEEGKK